MKKNGFQLSVLISGMFYLSILAGCAQPVSGSDSTKFPYSLIGQSYPADKDPKALNTYTHLGGSLITPVQLKEQVIVSVYQKDASRLLLFSQRQSDTMKNFTVMAVINIPEIPKGYHLVHGQCRDNKVEQPGIVAIMKPEAEYSRNIRQAWLYDWVSDTLTEMNPKTVDCYNEFFDLSLHISSIPNNLK